MPNIPRLIHKARSGQAHVFEPSAGVGAEPGLPQITLRTGRLVTGVLRVLQESAVNGWAVTGHSGGKHGA